MRLLILLLSTARNWSQSATELAPSEGMATTIGGATLGELESGITPDGTAGGVYGVFGQHEARTTPALLATVYRLEIDPIHMTSKIFHGLFVDQAVGLRGGFP